MNKCKSAILIILMMVFLTVPAFAENARFSIEFPDYYEKISDYEWFTDKYTINDEPTQIMVTVSFEDASFSKESFFSQSNLKKLKNKIAVTEGFDKFIDEPAESEAAGKYRCILSSYVKNENGIIIYYFCSDSAVCTVEFVADNPIYALTEGRDVIDTISFADDFYTPEIPVETDDINITEEPYESTPQKHDGFDWGMVLVGIIATILYGLVVYIIANAIYWKFDHGKWDKGAKPDTCATIIDFSSKTVSFGRNNTKFKTTLTFSDGYKFTTTKTKRKNKFLTYQISIDEELRKEIIDRATKSHKKALENSTYEASQLKKKLLRRWSLILFIVSFSGIAPLSVVNEYSISRPGLVNLVNILLCILIIGGLTASIILFCISFTVKEFKQTPSPQKVKEAEKIPASTTTINTGYEGVINPVEPKTRERSIETLRSTIIDQMTKFETLEVQLCSLLWQDAADCFPTGYSWNWDGAFFKLDLNTMRLFVNVSTYPNQFGACREETHSLSAIQFAQIVHKYNLSEELRFIQSADDLDALLNDELKTAISRTREVINRKKEEQMLLSKVSIPDEYRDATPAMNLDRVELKLFQMYSDTEIVLAKSEGKYTIEHLNFSKCTYKPNTNRRTLTSAEAARIEDMVNQTLNNKDDSTWSSLPGGDSMTIKITASGRELVNIEHHLPFQKYSDLMHELEKIARYGSCFESEKATL